MSNRLGIVLGLIFLLSMTLISCKEKDYGGEDMINYPDLESVFSEVVDIESPINYIYVRQEGDKKDSSDMAYGKVPWDEIISLIADANLQKEELNHKYSISILTDSMANTRTLYYEALDPEIATRSLSITSSLTEDRIENLYFDYKKSSGSKKRNARVLLIPNKLIQIQTREKKNTVVDNYYYP